MNSIMGKGALVVLFAAVVATGVFAPAWLDLVHVGVMPASLGVVALAWLVVCRCGMHQSWRRFVCAWLLGAAAGASIVAWGVWASWTIDTPVPHEQSVALQVANLILMVALSASALLALTAREVPEPTPGGEGVRSTESANAEGLRRGV